MHRPRKVCRKVQQFSIFLVLFGIPLPLLVDTKRKTKPKINCFKYSSTIYYEFLGSLSSGQGDLEKWNMFLFDLFLHLPSSVFSNSANFFVTPNLIRRQHYFGCSTSEQKNRIEKFLASIFSHPYCSSVKANQSTFQSTLCAFIEGFALDNIQMKDEWEERISNQSKSRNLSGKHMERAIDWTHHIVEIEEVIDWWHQYFFVYKFDNRENNE